MTEHRDPLTSHPDDLRALRDFRAEDATPDADARAAARVALLERIEAEAAPAPGAPRVRRPRRRLLPGGLAVAAAAAAVLAFVVGVGSDDVGRPQAADAAQELREAASVAAGGPDVDLSDGKWWYTSTEVTMSTRPYFFGMPEGQVTVTLVDVRERTEQWTNREGDFRTVTQVISEPEFATPRDREEWIAGGRFDFNERHTWTTSGRPGKATALDGPPLPRPKDGWQLLVGMSYEDLRALPTDEDALAQRLAQLAAKTPGGPSPFALATGLLRRAPISPEQRAAIYRMLAATPGVELLGTVKDEHGRKGTGIALKQDNARMELLFDPDTALLLDVDQTRERLRDPNPEDPAAALLPQRQSEAFLAATVVDSNTARP
jgi:hypothetical protein